MSPNPLRQFMLAALLWLPAMFFLWFWLAPLLMWPVIALARAVLLEYWPYLISGVEQHGFLMEVATRILVAQAGEGPSRVGELVLSVNPMVYGYPLPLYAGLVSATPLVPSKRVWQLGVGLLCIGLAQSLGALAETFKLLAFDSGPEGRVAVTQAGFAADAIALGYQFGYLILPAILPVVLWIVFNRVFIETLTLRHAFIEPVTPSRVETPANPNE